MSTDLDILMRRAGGIKRYHNRPIIGEQTVAAHTWGVTVLLFEMFEGCPSVSLLYAATFHDVAEVRTGDVPADAKERWPNIRVALAVAEIEADKELSLAETSLTGSEQFALKCADLLELLWFCYEQRRLGNQGLDEVWEIGYQSLLERLQKAVGCPDVDTKLHNTIWNMKCAVAQARADLLFPNDPSSH